MAKSKKITSEFEMESGLMSAGSVDTNSAEYTEALAAMYNRIQEQSEAEKLLTKMTALQLRMKKYLDAQVDSSDDIKRVHFFYKEMLKTSGTNNSRLARYIGLKPNNLSTMFRDGKVNYRTAKILQSIFKIDHSLWLDIQYKNDYLSTPTKEKKRYNEYSFEELLGE